jgi:hypothetical protein
MNEMDAVENAFGAKIEVIFATFFQAYTDAQGDAAKRKQAEKAFVHAVAHAREVRQRAIALLRQRD